MINENAIKAKISKTSGRYPWKVEVGSGNNMALVRVNNAIAKIEQRGQSVSKWMKENMDLGKGRSHDNTNTYSGLEARRAGQRAGESIRIGSAKGSLANGQRQLA